MFTRQVALIKLLSCKQLRNNFHLTTTKCEFSSNSTGELEKSELPRMNQWRKPWNEKEGEWYSKLKVFSGDDQPNVKFITLMQTPIDFTPGSIRRWLEKKKVFMNKFDQRFIKERHEMLGCDLASAHFLVHRGGRVKFLGKDDWVKKDEEDQYDLPSKFVSNYVIESLDASGMSIYYEGLENLCRLTHLKWLSFKGCPYFDDWCIDRISGDYPRLEYLDISDCEKVTERGLEALYRMQKLKTLVVTNHYKSPAFELTCMMLEDCNPNLKCEILVPESKPQLTEDSK